MSEEMDPNSLSNMILCPPWMQESFQASLRVQQAAFEALAMPLSQVIQKCLECMQRGGTLFWAGNGTSAADAQRISAELVGRFQKERPAIKSFALTTNSSLLTGLSNDYGYAFVFERQLEAFIGEKDVLILLSTSGNSKNLIRAAQSAKYKGAFVIGFTGKTGGKLNDFCDLLLRVPSIETSRIQEAHFLLSHLFCEGIERKNS